MFLSSMMTEISKERTSFTSTTLPGKQILDEQGRPKLRERTMLDTLECGDFLFATACLLANRKYA